MPGKLHYARRGGEGEGGEINQASLVLKAKGGRGMPGSDVCDYGHLLALDYQHKEEQSCNVKSCSGQQQSVVSHAAGSKAIAIHLTSKLNFRASCPSD